MKKISLAMATGPAVLRCMITPAFAASETGGTAAWGEKWLLVALVVIGALAVLALIGLQYRLVRRLRRMTRLDELTGLMNKRTFCTEIKKRMAAGKPYTMVRFDIDHFKLINETMGVSNGDRLLQTIGSVLLEATKARWEILAVGRLDADHFALCTEMGRLATEHFCQQVEKAIHACTAGYDITLRFGLCDVDDVDAEISVYCDRALTALRSVKDIYRGSLAWYDSDMRREEQRIQELEAVMESALAAGEFVPYFQAQYDYQTGQIIGAEALVRWISPEKGMIPPDQFIPLFEKNGFIYKMDLAMWEQVCARIRAWLDAGLAVPHLSVNVSRCDIAHSDMPGQLKRLVDKYGLTPDMLHLESTETGFAERPEQMLEVTNQLRAMGFCIEIDDFGSGYSSLNTLRQLPADVLKLDRRFLDDRGGTSHSRGDLILSSVVRMAHSIGLLVVAEGVETKEQADFLKSIGCLCMQGYYFARPVSASDFTALLQSRGVSSAVPQSSGDGSDAADFLDASTQSALLFNGLVGGAGIFEYRNGRLEVLRLNDQFFDVTGISHDGHNGFCIDLMETLTEETRPAFVGMLDEAVTGGRQSSCYCCSNMTDSQGVNQWFFYRTRCLQRQGDTYIIYILLENITDWMQEIRHMEARGQTAASMLSHFPGGYAAVRCDSSGLHTESFGGQLTRRLGYTEAELLHLTEQDPLALLHPACRTRAEHELTGLLRGRTLRTRYLLTAKSGVDMWFDVTGVADGTAQEQKLYFYYTEPVEQGTQSPFSKTQKTDGGDTFQDALELMGTDLYKVLRVDLTADTFKIIRSDLPEPEGKTYTHFSQWLRDVGASDLIYEEDRANFEATVTVEHLQEYFKQRYAGFRFHYRRRITEGYRWVCMDILRLPLPDTESQVIMLYIRDIHESYEAQVQQRRSADYKMRHDVLTGVNNRLAYSERIAQLAARHASVGVIYADINGLKHTNDTKGHDAGDELIVDFVKRLSTVFGVENCYRISGDEFIVLMETDKQRFLALENALLTPLNREGLPAASYGSSWCEDSGYIDQARREAEERMYRWKKVHYTNHPELGRRE